MAPRSPNGFTLIEMLVALLLLGLVGLTLVRFQTLQMAGTRRLQQAAAARIEADNRMVDILVARAAPSGPVSGESANFGRTWFWTATPGPSPDPALLPEAVTVTVDVRADPGGPVLAGRQLVRARR